MLCSLLFTVIIPSIFTRLLGNAGTIILLGTIALFMPRMGFSVALFLCLLSASNSCCLRRVESFVLQIGSPLCVENDVVIIPQLIDGMLDKQNQIIRQFDMRAEMFDRLFDGLDRTRKPLENLPRD